MTLTKNYLIRAVNIYCRCRRYSQKSFAVKNKIVENDDLAYIRNIGILAHIDAGKTTTTERMLFYSGTIGQMGEVHHGNTVTDFMEQERQRGITIAAASVAFQWNKHNINLLDTPGHIDFTVEVEQTLNVMDGAVIILDGSAGVEAQTITVWKQADRYQIPRIIYINKMDKPGAGFFRSIHSIYKQLQVTPVIIQLPIIDKSKVFKGVVDLLSLEKCEWNASDSGVLYCRNALKSEDGELLESSLKARVKLTETLADLDDKMAEIIISDESKLNTVSSNTLKESIRKVTLERKGVPVLCGSSYKNIGVQLLMDAVNDYLPSPLCSQSGRVIESFGNNLCARAFKVRHDEHKGPVTFFRIYSGEISKGQKVYNVNKEKTETCGKLYTAYADDLEGVPRVGAGNIAAVTGLKLTTSGDLVSSSATAFQSGRKALLSKTKTDRSDSFTVGPYIPDPVFFCSIEAPSQSQQGALDKALSELEREDPSLKVKVNNETGQTVLGGMGELHLEIIKERIRSEYRVEAESGPLQIAYKEELIETAKDEHVVQQKIGSSTQFVKLIMSVFNSESKEKLLLDKSPESSENIQAIFPKHLLAVKNGIENALTCGPKLYSPVINVSVMLHWLEVGKGTSEAMISSATSQCVKKLLKKGDTRLLEPIMSVEIVCTDSLLEKILNDLGKRRADISETDSRGTEMVVRALVPLSELLGYSKELRILSSGRANLSMEFHSYRRMNSVDETKAVKSVTGFSC